MFQVKLGLRDVAATKLGRKSCCHRRCCYLMLPAQAEKEATEAPVSASRRFGRAGQAKLRAGYPAQEPTCRAGTARLGEGSSGEAAGGLSSHRA